MSRFIRAFSLIVLTIVAMRGLQAQSTSPPCTIAPGAIWQPSRDIFSDYRCYLDYPSPDTNYTKFWAHNYLPDDLVTHTGSDYNLAENGAHVFVPWNAFGKVEDTLSPTSGSNIASTITVRQLLQNGSYLFCKGLHFYAGSIRVAAGDYVAQGHLVAREGNTGVNIPYTDDSSNAHFHYECGNRGPTYWVSSFSTCPDSAQADETEYCAASGRQADRRDTSRDLDGILLAHYGNGGSGTIGNSGKVWYSPQMVLRQYSELIPCLSRSSSVACASTPGGYDVYGVANRPFYGQLNARGAFDEVGIIARAGDAILRTNAETSSYSSVLGEERKWLARATGNVNVMASLASARTTDLETISF